MVCELNQIAHLSKIFHSHAKKKNYVVVVQNVVCISCIYFSKFTHTSSIVNNLHDYFCFSFFFLLLWSAFVPLVQHHGNKKKMKFSFIIPNVCNGSKVRIIEKWKMTETKKKVNLIRNIAAVGTSVFFFFHH